MSSPKIPEVSDELTRLIDILTGGRWCLRTEAGHTATEVLRFLRHRRVGGYSHPNEYAWDVRNRCLCFLNKDGIITSSFPEDVSDEQRYVFRGYSLIHQGNPVRIERDRYVTVDQESSTALNVPKQESFRNSTKLSILKYAPTRKRSLVFIRLGSNCLQPIAQQFLDGDNDFDLALSYYANPDKGNPLLPRAKIILAGGLSKFDAAKKFLLLTDVLERYESFLFLDEDVELLFNPDEFFEFCKAAKLSIAQASLTSDSIVPHAITRCNPSFVYRTTNFVEVMAPLFSQDFLASVYHSFDHSICTWGLDVIWGTRIDGPRTAAIIDRYQMRHPKPSYAR